MMHVDVEDMSSSQAQEDESKSLMGLVTLTNLHTFTHRTMISRGIY
jgi:hypothetical protein